MTNLTLPRTDQRTRIEVPKYGYYFFAPYISMLAFFLIAGTVGIFMGVARQSPSIVYLGIATAAYGILTTIGWAVARYVIPGNRVAVARRIVSDLNLNGSERVLDVGSGRGLYAIEAAHRLSSGRVCGVDVWDAATVEDLSFHHRFSQPTGNTVDNAKKNARLAGVSDKVKFINMDAANLKFTESSFDVIICGFVLSHLWRNQREVITELRRVLKAGGRLMIIDNVRDLTYFLLSTPHLFLWSYLRGRKAKRLSRENWLTSIRQSGFRIRHWRMEKGIITVECVRDE